MVDMEISGYQSVRRDPHITREMVVATIRNATDGVGDFPYTGLSGLHAGL